MLREFASKIGLQENISMIDIQAIKTYNFLKRNIYASLYKTKHDSNSKCTFKTPYPASSVRSQASTNQNDSYLTCLV